MNYPEALIYLEQLTKFGFNFGLQRIQELMARLGHPEEKLRYIHIAGTNGKGSVAAMTSAILQEAGLRVGLFTSPHLHRWTERIRLNGAEISEDQVAALITSLRPLLEAMVAEGFEHPTEFEVSTAVALEYFAREKADIVVLEVGLGGAIDSTNVIPSSLVSVITNVGLDHMDYLGRTLPEIARVKAGIIKPGGVVVTATSRAEAREVIEAVCREQKATLYEVGRDVTWQEKEVSLEGARFDLHGLLADYRDLKVGLLGRHQIINAATAAATVEAAVKHHGLPVREKHLRLGLAQAKWPARLEIMKRNPLVIIDGAHNYDGALTLRRALEDLFTWRRLVLVLSMLADKEREKVMQLLAPLADAVIVTKPPNPRAGNWQDLAVIARRWVADVEIEEKLPRALNLAFSKAGPKDLICITGSLYMVADARELLLKG
ncbi:MAG: dihydrofolate synthase / folylpolyglutamate synthase [Clostridia bacterium]|nr:dihydrofolate synthase / folylpolyglutamate synthase [Clostridia bacterium]